VNKLHITHQLSLERAPLSRRFVFFTLQYGTPIWICAALIAVVALWRTCDLYMHLRSDLEQLLPRESASVRALEEMNQRISGLRHLGVVVEARDASQMRAAEQFIDDLAARVGTYPRDLVRSVRTNTLAERHFFEQHAAIYIDPSDLRRIRSLIEQKRDRLVSRETGVDLELESGDSPNNDAPSASAAPADCVGPRVRDESGSTGDVHNAHYSEASACDLKALEEKITSRIPHHLKSTTPTRFSDAAIHASLLVVDVGEFETGTRQGTELLRRVTTDIAELGGPERYAPGMRVGLAGDVAIAVEELDALIADLALSSILVFAAVIALLIAYYRWVWCIAVLIPPLLVATVYAFALCSLPPFSITELNSNTAFLGAILVGNGINFGIILLACYCHERRRYPSASVFDAVHRAVVGAQRGTFAAALAASASYAALVSTEFRGFRQFGILGGVGMLTAWTVTFVAMPPLIVWFDRGRTALAPRKVRTHPKRDITTVAMRYPRSVIAAAAIVTAWAAFRVGSFRFDQIETDVSTLRRRDTWQHGEGYWGRKMDQILGHYLTPTVLLTNSVDDARVLASELRKRASEPPLAEAIADVRSLDDLVPLDQRSRLSEAETIHEVLTPRVRASIPEPSATWLDHIVSSAGVRSPRSTSMQSAPIDTPIRGAMTAGRTAVAGADSDSGSDSDAGLDARGEADVKTDTREVRLEALPSTLTAGMLERDASSGKTILVFPRPSKALWQGEALSAFVGQLRQVAACCTQIPARVAGSLPISADILSSIRRDGFRASAVALLGVFAVVVAIFRRSAATGLVIASLLMGIAWMVAIAMSFGVKINFANFIAYPITFGIGADYAMNVMSKHLHSAKSGNHAEAMSETAGAVILCSLTTIVGYASLLVAQNRALYLFGVLAVLGELTCLASAVTVVPAVLALTTRRRGSSTSTPPTCST